MARKLTLSYVRRWGRRDQVALCRLLVTFVDVARRIGERPLGECEFGPYPQHRHHSLRIERTAAREAFTLAEQRIDVPLRCVLGHVWQTLSIDRHRLGAVPRIEQPVDRLGRCADEADE